MIKERGINTRGKTKKETFSDGRNVYDGNGLIYLCVKNVGVGMECCPADFDARHDAFACLR